MTAYGRRHRSRSKLQQLADPVHYRDPEDGNERSACNAEEQATFTGAQVVCTIDICEVTCPNCLVKAPSKAYVEWDDAIDAPKQLRKYPDAWVNLTGRFKVGDKIVWLVSDHVWLRPMTTDEKRHGGRETGPDAEGNRQGMVGVVEEIRNGHRDFWPPHLYTSDTESHWLSESVGCLVVRFPGGNHGFEDDGRAKPIAVLPGEEGRTWERAK